MSSFENLRIVEYGGTADVFAFQDSLDWLSEKLADEEGSLALPICAKLEADLAAIPVGSIKAMNYCHEVLIPDMAEARKAADQLETLTASKSWPFPVYSDLLFYV